MGGSVINVETLEQFNTILKESGDKLVVVDFTAAWCGPCRIIGPEFEKESVNPLNKNVVFLKVDVDEAVEVTSHCGVTAMPTFIFFKNGTKVFEILGANKPELLNKLAELRT